jgi:hypothetical protein
MLRLRQAPIGPQDAQKLRRQHGVAFLAALSALDPDHHPFAVDITDLQCDHLRDAQAGRIRRGQGRAALQARHGFEKTHHLLGAEHHRQLAWLTSVGDPLRYLGARERDPVEETQRADDLIEARPGHALGRQMNLIGANILQAELIRRLAEILAKLCHRMHVRLLSRRGQIADRHVLDHPAT